MLLRRVIRLGCLSIASFFWTSCSDDSSTQVSVTDVYSHFVHTHHCDIFLEEPEANLFPPTQSNLVEWLLTMITGKHHSNLFIATHSPYILNSFLEKQNMDITLLYTRIEEKMMIVKTASDQDIQDIYDYGVDAFFNIETLG